MQFHTHIDNTPDLSVHEMQERSNLLPRLQFWGFLPTVSCSSLKLPLLSHPSNKALLSHPHITQTGLVFILDWKSISETLLGKPKSLTEDAITGLEDVKERGRNQVWILLYKLSIKNK